MAKPLMSLRLPDAKQKRWAEFAEQSDEVQNRTDLIETAVERFMQTGGFEDEGALAQKEAISELQGSVNQLHQTLEEMEKDLRQVKRQTAAASQQVEELAHDVLNLLPDARDIDLQEAEHIITQAQEGTLSPDLASPDAEIEVPVTADLLQSWLQQDVKKEYDYPLSRGDVMDALEYLQRQHVARAVEIAGETRWLKEV